MEMMGRRVTFGEPFLWDGDYNKELYLVHTPDGDKVPCWPNAGYMVALDGSGRQWEPADQVMVARCTQVEELVSEEQMGDVVDQLLSEVVGEIRDRVDDERTKMVLENAERRKLKEQQVVNPQDAMITNAFESMYQPRQRKRDFSVGSFDAYKEGNSKVIASRQIRDDLLDKASEGNPLRRLLLSDPKLMVLPADHMLEQRRLAKKARRKGKKR